MAGKVGEAFVEIVADYKEFVRKADKELNVLLKRMAGKADFAPMQEASGDAGEESARDYTESFDREINRSTTRTRRRRTAERAGRDYSRAFRDGSNDEGRRRGIFSGGGGGGGRDKDRSSGLLGKVGGAVSGLLGGLGAVGSAAGTVVGGIGSIISSLGTLLTIVFIAAPALYVLAGALISLSGLAFALPAGLATLGIALGVVQIAFMGFGDAISAAASGDMKAFDEALKGLTPSARKVAQEFKDSLLPAFEKVKSVVQEGFFQPLVGTLDNFGKDVLPAITPGLKRISQDLGDIAGIFLDKLSSPKGIEFFKKMLDTVANIIERAGPGIESLFTGLGDMFVASLPFAEKLFGAITDGLGDFGEFLSKKDTQDSFQKFLQDAWDTGKEFMNVIKELLGLFKALFANTDEGGKKFLKDIGEALKKLKEFFESPEGKNALQLMIDLAKLLGAALIFVAGKVGALYWLLRKVAHMAKDAWHWLEKVAGKAASFGGGIGSSVARWAKLHDIPGFADGAVVNRPTFAMVGEAGPEVVVPLNNPGRARDLMEQSGLMNLAGGAGGGDTQVIVYLGTEQITDILDQRVVKGFKAQGKRLTQGVREG